MEFLKNRQKVLVDALQQMQAPNGASSVPPIVAEFQPRKILAKNLKDASKNYKKTISRIETILRNPTANDPVYKSIKRIFDFNSERNLKRPNKQRFSIRRLARKRFSLGYPPRKNNDTSIGDAYNWEWIVHCAKQSIENHHVLIVSRDTDYGVIYKKTAYLNDWLKREFKDRVSRKRKIELTAKLSDALRVLDEIVLPEDEEQEEKLLTSNTETESTNNKNSKITYKKESLVDLIVQLLNDKQN